MAKTDTPAKPADSTTRRRPEKPSMRVKDGRKQPFVWFPPELLPQYGAAMGAYAGWVYMSILTHLNRKQGHCYLALETIATETGMSKRKVQSSLKKLETLGLIGITMRRPKVSLFDVLDLPERPVNTHDMPIPAPESNTHVVPVNTHVVPVNTHVVPVQHARGAYEPEVLVPEVEDQKTTTTTLTPSEIINMTPMSADVEVVGEAVAIAQGKETHTQDGGIGSEAPLWRQFYDRYPTHGFPERTADQWDRQSCDAATLATIIDKLPWQRRLTGLRALPDLPHKYLIDRRWLDEGPSRPEYRPEAPAPPPCHVDDCEAPMDPSVSNKKCLAHFLAALESEAQQAVVALAPYTAFR